MSSPNTRPQSLPESTKRYRRVKHATASTLPASGPAVSIEQWVSALATHLTALAASSYAAAEQRVSDAMRRDPLW